MPKTVAGFYCTAEDARSAGADLLRAGFPGGNTTILDGHERARTLTTLGVPPDHAEHYAEGLRRGGAVVIVHCGDTAVPQALEILERHGAQDIHKLAEDWRREGVPLEFVEKREEPVVSRHPQVVEEVVLRKQVREGRQTIRDHVKRSHVEVERAEGFRREPVSGVRGVWQQFKDALRVGRDKLRRR